ncbi:hypothetical protein ABBQ38_001647 [Trebouxia sp. C0009 RCD-2024]
MFSVTSQTTCQTCSSRAFRGQVAPLIPGRVQQRWPTSLKVVHAKKRSEDVQEEAVGGLKGLANKVKSATITISSRGGSPRKQGSKSKDASPAKKLTNKVKAATATQSSRAGIPRGGSARKQASRPQESSPTKKQEGLRVGTFSLGGSGGRKSDPNTVFVAGATGRLGCRVVREILGNKKLKVRAGARNPQEARDLVKTATEYGLLTAEQARRLTVVPVDLEDEDSIAPALGNAGKVVQAIGAAETKLLDFGAPSRIDGEAAIKLVNVAKDLGVKQYIMVTSLGTTKIGFPASLLNLFWGILTFKKKAEKALQASGIPYVIVRPGGMERPTDAYKRTHNVRLATRDKLFGGQVSRLQVAELIAAAVTNPEAAENKVLEVVAEEGAEAREYLDLLTAHPVDGETSTAPSRSSPQQEEGPTPKLGAAKQQVGQKAQQAKQTASRAASQVTPGLESTAEDVVDAVDSVKKSFFQSAEDLDQQRLEAQRKKDADMKQERADRARKNAELVAQQKVEREAQAKKQAEEDKQKEQQQAKKDAETKAAADKKKKKDAEAKAAADAKKKTESKPPPAKTQPKKKVEAKEAPKAEPKAAPKAAPKAEPKKKTEGKAAETSEAKEQAKRAAEGSKEAQEWINNWKNGKTTEAAQAAKQVAAKAAGPAKQAQQAASDAASSAEKPSRDLLSNVLSGLKLPWQQGNGAKQQQSGPQQGSKPAASQPQKVDAKSGETIEQRQKEARKWINDWRARTLETKLPQEVSAKK